MQRFFNIYADGPTGEGQPYASTPYPSAEIADCAATNYRTSILERDLHVAAISDLAAANGHDRYKALFPEPTLDSSGRGGTCSAHGSLGTTAHVPLCSEQAMAAVKPSVGFRVPLTLGYDSQKRKDTPMLAVVFGYFAAAMAGLTRHAIRSNEKHNPGEPLHWARGKSMDHSECSLRHLVDGEEIRAWLRRNPDHPHREEVLTALEHELDARVWRANAESQQFYEEFRGAPLSFSSRASE